MDKGFIQRVKKQGANEIAEFPDDALMFIFDALEKIEKLKALVKESFCEGFQEGKDGGWIVGAEGEPWRKSQSKVKLKEIK